MDIVYIVIVGALWAATIGLVYGCSRLQSRKVSR